MTPHAQGRIAGLLEAAGWHDMRAHDTPDAVETELHQASASAIRLLAEKEAPDGLTPLERELVETANAFLDRIGELEPLVNGAIQIAAIHGAVWGEKDNYCKEREALRSALSKSEQKERQP